MPFSQGGLRTIIAAVVGVLSVTAGLVLAFRLVTPERVNGLQTTELLGLLGLLVLPLAALWLRVVDRRAGARRTVAGAHRADLAPAALSDGEVAELNEIVIELTPVLDAELHPAGRRTVQHRRAEKRRQCV